MSETIASALGYSALVFTTLLFLSPMPTFARIIRERSTLAFSGTPYVVSLCQCCFWVAYASGEGLKEPGLTNFIGAVLHAHYCLLFAIYTRKRWHFFGKLLVPGVVGTAITIACVLTFLDRHHALSVLGICADIGNVLMYASPFSAMLLVLRTKDVAFMPLPLTLAGFACSAAWSIYAVYKSNVALLVPNFLGVLLHVGQLLLYLSFCGRTNVSADFEIESEPLLNLPRDRFSRAALPWR